MAKPNAKNVQAFRQRQKEQQVVRLEIYCHEDDAALIKELAQKLKEKRNG